MTGETTGTRTTGPTLIVEDNAFLSTELFEALQEAGLNPLPPVSHYTAALTSLSQNTPRLCVLDLDLGRQMSSNVVIGEEGRRLLAILHARGCRTAVYSAYVSNSLGLRDIAPLSDRGSSSAWGAIACYGTTNIVLMSPSSVMVRR